jgi:hypothetical protein
LKEKRKSLKAKIKMKRIEMAMPKRRIEINNCMLNKRQIAMKNGTPGKEVVAFTRIREAGCPSRVAFTNSEKRKRNDSRTLGNIMVVMMSPVILWWWRGVCWLWPSRSPICPLG